MARRDPSVYKAEEAAFLRQAEERCSPEVVRVLRALHDMKLHSSDDPWWPFGNWSFAFRIERGTARCSVFNAYRNGWLTILFCYLRNPKYGVGEAAWRQFADDLAQIPGFSNIHTELARTAVIHYRIGTALASADDLSAFKSAVLKLRDSVPR